MRSTLIVVHGKRARILTEVTSNDYHFKYDENHEGEAVVNHAREGNKYWYKSFTSFLACCLRVSY